MARERRLLGAGAGRRNGRDVAGAILEGTSAGDERSHNMGHRFSTCPPWHLRVACARSLRSRNAVER